MRKATTACIAVLVAAAAPALGVNYVELTPWSTVQAGTTSTSHYGVVVDGQTSYHNLSLGGGGAITKVVD